jgi:hypothetical protein
MEPESTPGDSGAKPARQRLMELRVALLRLHKVLLELERRDYERMHGRVSSSELFRLVIDDSQFAWLHSISEFVVRLDEMLDGDAAIAAVDVRSVYSLARNMFTASESGDAFQKKYFEAIQRDPAVVIELAEVARLFAEDSPEAGAA